MDVHVEEAVNLLSVQQNQLANQAIESSDEDINNQAGDRVKTQAKKLVEEANKLLQPELTEVKYVYFDKLQTYYVQVVDTNTNEVIREIPLEKFMEMYAAIAEKLGLIVNHHV
ncbi:MAG: flagellar protein FlaG [Sporolactobacillus sp.]|jgi:flagellar protein FlaG|nr:flagellar protein FlaG [Sporolactobacillus sp.]